MQESNDCVRKSDSWYTINEKVIAREGEGNFATHNTNQMQSNSDIVPCIQRIWRYRFNTQSREKNSSPNFQQFLIFERSNFGKKRIFSKLFCNNQITRENTKSAGSDT